ncbi:MAG: ATP-binding cassette domain-containing protein [Nitriliruptorales bacterium]|nr:ATP-binding cassette domain-containing protein [Nitriliruptorales bacterium]
MLSISNLEVVYDDVILVLRGISLDVPDGSIVALLGANGAGKTTLLRSITGLLDLHEGEITKGRITLDGEPIQKLPASRIVHRGIKQVMEGRRVFAEFTVEENLRVGAHTAKRGSTAASLDRVYGLFPALRDRRRQAAGYLSGGEQQMLAMGRALMSDPRCLLLDEPSLGLAPLLVQQIRDLIVEINAQGTTVLLVEQNANMALSIAAQGYIMETGKIVMDKPSSELLDDEDVREFYLGLREGSDAKSFREVKHYKRRKRWLS